MALCISEVRIFYDQDDTPIAKRRLADNFVKQGFTQISECKNGEGAVLSHLFQARPQIILARDVEETIDKEKKNIYTFNPEGGNR